MHPVPCGQNGGSKCKEVRTCIFSTSKHSCAYYATGSRMVPGSSILAVSRGLRRLTSTVSRGCCEGPAEYLGIEQRTPVPRPRWVQGWVWCVVYAVCKRNASVGMSYGGGIGCSWGCLRRPVGGRAVVYGVKEVVCLCSCVWQGILLMTLTSDFQHLMYCV